MQWKTHTAAGIKNYIKKNIIIHNIKKIYSINNKIKWGGGGTDFDEPRLGVFGLLVHVDVAHVDFDAQLLDAHPHGAAGRRRRHVNEFDGCRWEAHLLPWVHDD